MFKQKNKSSQVLARVLVSGVLVNIVYSLTGRTTVQRNDTSVSKTDPTQTEAPAFSLARVNLEALAARATLDLAAPVELAVAPLVDGAPLGVVAATAAQEVAAVDAR